MTARHPFLPVTLAALALAVLTGCHTPAHLLGTLAEEREMPYRPVNHRGDARLPDDLHRVAVLPVHGGALAPTESAEALDGVLAAALQRQQRFEIVTVSREECRRLFGAADFSSVAALPHGFLDKLAARYAADAVLFTDLTVYRPYQPLALGFRAKLATTRDVRLVWAFDEVFSAEDPRLRRSLRLRQRTAEPAALVDPAPAVLQSPRRFGTVAADLMFGTLPPR
ncbi:MAG: hypothetical protein ACOZE5_06050 [Verrucomicrobiota bacterium]